MSLLLQILAVLLISVAVVKWYVSLKGLASKEIKPNQTVWVILIDFLITAIVVSSAIFFLTPLESFGGGSVGAFFFTLIVIPVLLILNISGFILSVSTKQSKWTALLFYVLPALVFILGLNISQVLEKSKWDSREEIYIAQLMTPSLTRFVCQGDASISIVGTKVLIEMIEGEPSLLSNPVGGYVDNVAGTFTWYADYDFSSEGSYGSIKRVALQSCKNSEGKAILEMYTEMPYTEPITPL
jgi:hypothetical protein